MAVGTSAMGITYLAEFLTEQGTYATISEATTALQATYIQQAGAVAGTAVKTTGGTFSAIVGNAGETAAELAARTTLEVGKAEVRTAAVGITENVAQVSFSPAAILGMDIGVVGAAVAPLLGVSLGFGLYEASPEFWTRLSQKLLPFCYPGTTKIPTWAEVIYGDKWETSIPKKVFDAIKDFFTEEGIFEPIVQPPEYDGSIAVTTTASGPAGYEILLSYINNVYRYMFNNSITRFNWSISQITELLETIPNIHESVMTWEFSQTSISLTTILIGSQITFGRTIFSEAGIQVGSITGVKNSYLIHQGSDGPILSDLGPDRMSYWFPGSTFYERLPRTSNRNTAIGYTVGAESSYNYPDGVSKWKGNPVPEEVPQVKPAVIGIDSTTGEPITQPMVPISPPEFVPQVQPTVLPNPTIIPFPWPKPEVLPETEPWPETMPYPLPEQRPEWWPISIPYPDNFPLPNPTQDPIEFPDPTITTNPEKQVEPWIMPMPLPWEYPVPYPNQYPNTNPEANPSPNADPNPNVDPSQPRPATPPNTTNPNIPLIDILPYPEGVSPLPEVDTPVPFSSVAGLATVYHPSPNQLYSFAQWLWVTLEQADINKVWNNPFDGVVTLFELYCTPTDNGNRNIHSGFLDSGINSPTISRYTSIDCGTLAIPEYYGNYFDYSPYTRCSVYLPFIGIQDLNPDDIVGHAVNITYKIDQYNGSCICLITVAKATTVNGKKEVYSNTMYQFSGNCAVEVPISGGSQASIKAGMMMADSARQAANAASASGLLGGLASLLTGNVGGGVGGVVGAMATQAYGEYSALGNMLSGKASVQKSGSFGSSYGAMGIKKPYIVITRPKQIVVPNYEELYGYPSHKMVVVGNCKGYLRCREVHVVSATANDEEKNMIESLLKSGVYIDE